MAHEIYEIILENMGVKDSGGPLDPLVCLQAERFAVAALMQPDIFASHAQACGLDVVALHDRFGSAYVSAALRLAEVVRHPPLLVVLYEHTERGDPALWPPGNDLARLRAKVVRRTEGFRARRSRLLGGRRGGMPYKDRAVPARLPGGTGCLQQQYRVRRGGRLGRCGHARDLEGEAGQGGGGGRARRVPRCPGAAAG